MHLGVKFFNPAKFRWIPVNFLLRLLKMRTDVLRLSQETR
jgi:hypothetical protein